MKFRGLVLAVAIGSLGSLGTVCAQDEKLVYPILRFWVSSEKQLNAEYIGGASDFTLTTARS